MVALKNRHHNDCFLPRWIPTSGNERIYRAWRGWRHVDIDAILLSVGDTVAAEDDSMTLQPRRINLTANCHLLLDPDPDAPQRYFVRFFGLDRDRAAQAATEHARVRQMMANLRGQAVYPYPLPQRVTIGSFDRDGWHCGGSEYALSLAAMPRVQEALERLRGDLQLRVALVSACRTPAP
jgi:hypothetical protein